MAAKIEKIKLLNLFIAVSFQKQPPRLFSKISVPFSGVFQDVLCVHRTTDANFPGRFVCLLNRYKFSRRTIHVTIRHVEDDGGRGLFTEQIQFFQEPSLCVHRTDTDFPEALF